MNIRITWLAMAAAFAAGGAHTSAHAAANAVRVCTLPGSPTAALDQAVARAVLKTAGVAATFVTHGIGDDGGDDGISAHELASSLGRDCDLVAGFPRSSVADASGSQMIFSQGYLRSGYVSVTLRHPRAAATAADGKETVAATWSSPSQLIAVQQKNARFDLENTSALTVDAVAKGRAQRAIVWYPAVVAYQRAHPQHRFAVAATASPYADWHLVFASGSGMRALQMRIDNALARMNDDGRLAALTRGWTLPESAANALLESTKPSYRRTAMDGRGSFIKVSTTAGGNAPAFDHEQVEHGQHLYSESCAKCHGAQLEGITAPALSGPAFAPAANSHLTIGGIYQYMSTNMPADRPGKMTDQEYADLMAFLLYTNGYDAGNAKLTSDAAQSSTTPLNAGPRH
ncbi:ABC-type amino acid transport substrate-binding protein [Paraburkholderia silvatlantica]|uniref:ABC-type amino acid transport substrate-binding protein n=1 Tax=Paraburkholderia silvatlantica TaxID=321895 RepID=A0A2V4UIX6_9BURK|nr:c-type cytochrome [Paraburkholderia silvatlantica]PYE24267.1 ABC-type amino acid transport substrate-binding protein [Paraburkholderia silvatlantica]